MDRTERFPIRRFASLDAMKSEEYSFWKNRPACERMRAVAEMSAEAYGHGNMLADAPRLQRTVVRIKR